MPFHVVAALAARRCCWLYFRLNFTFTFTSESFSSNFLSRTRAGTNYSRPSLGSPATPDIISPEYTFDRLMTSTQALALNDLRSLFKLHKSPSMSLAMLSVFYSVGGLGAGQAEGCTTKRKGRAGV